MASPSMPRRAVLAMLTAICSALGLLGAATPGHAASYASFKVLVFSKTTGFRHDSIPAGIQAIKNLGAANNFTVDATEDDTLFTDTNLAQYKTVVFLSATGDPVGTQAEKDAFQRYIQRGGGYVGVHAAADSGYAWAWYGKLVGAYFKQHPAIQPARLVVEDTAHPATSGLPSSFTRTDEWYDFQTNPRSTVHVLTSVDNSSYTGSTMGTDHPNTWCQNYDGGRAFYTALGHTTESYSEANFLHILLGGILTTAGAVAGNCSVSTPPPPTNTVISLRARANSKYVTADNAGASPLIANRTAIGPWEQFDQIDAGGGYIALRAHANNQYVCAENAGAASLIANRGAFGSWEKFQLIRNGDGSVSLKANANGKYVTAENGGNSALIANRTAIGLWESFDLITS
ncbi:ThuA domain-containing protein [Dactylosporangium sp. NPDC048998]|uniref:ThuA domain-containing protein n=1 Tax=Dactylosporangium sp. NPDC048998 TaxID=3363976 RepID=UPI00371BC1ED